MTTAVPIIRVQCSVCSGHVHPNEFVLIGESVIVCWKCYEKQTRQVEIFDPPKECGMCQTRFDVLAAREQSEHVSMFAHWKDGIFQMLCRDCDKKYVLQRADLYGKTRFGRERKIN